MIFLLSRLSYLTYIFCLFGLFQINSSFLMVPNELLNSICMYFVKDVIEKDQPKYDDAHFPGFLNKHLGSHSQIDTKTLYYISMQNGAKIDFIERKIWISGLSELLFVSKAIYEKIQPLMVPLYQYWFEQRKLLNINDELAFQYYWYKGQKRHFGFQIPYLKMIDICCEMNTFAEKMWMCYQPRVSIARVASDFFIVWLTRKLLKFYSEHKDGQELDQLREKIISELYHETSYERRPSVSAEQIVISAACSLILFMADFNNASLQEMQKDFLMLKELYNLLRNKSACSSDQEAISNMQGIDAITICNAKSCVDKSQCEHRLLQAAELVMPSCFYFEKFPEDKDQGCYNCLSYDKKLTFIYYKLTMKRRRAFHGQHRIWRGAWRVCSRKIQIYLEEKFSNFYDISHNTRCNLSSLLGELLHLYDLDVVFAYLKGYSKIHKSRIDQLRSNYPKLSNKTICENFYLFLNRSEAFEKYIVPGLNCTELYIKATNDLLLEKQSLEVGKQQDQEKFTTLWDEKKVLELRILELRKKFSLLGENFSFSKIQAQQNKERLEELSYLTMDLDSRVAELQNLKKEFEYRAAKKIRALEVELQGSKNINSQLIKDNAASVDNLKNEHSRWKKRAIGLFFVAQLILCMVYSCCNFKTLFKSFSIT